MTVKMWQTLKFTALLLEIGAFFCVVSELVFLTFVGALEIYVCVTMHCSRITLKHTSCLLYSIHNIA